MAVKITFTRANTNGRWQRTTVEDINDYDMATSKQQIKFMENLGGKEIRVNKNIHKSISPDGKTMVTFLRYGKEDL